MKIEYNSHLMEWTDEKVSRFWNFYNNYPPYADTWFTKIFGNGLLKFVSSRYKLKGKVLDYGTGKGFLLQYILDKQLPIELYACDFTDSIALQIDEKFRENEAFKGCTHITTLPSSYEDDQFDFVFLIETIEHLTDTYLHSTLKEIHRVLKPGGVVIITTPNDEELERNNVHCPECGSTFHLMQHLRSWNVAKLTKVCENFGFKTDLCKPINLLWYKKYGSFYYVTDIFKRLLRKKYPPNLIYTGRK